MFNETLCNARHLAVTSEVEMFVNGPWIATSCEMTMSGKETEWGGVGWGE